MRAANIALDASFSMVDRPAPEARAGYSLVTVVAAGIGPSDLMRAKGLYGGATMPDYVPGGEGIGRLADGTRIYFGHSAAPYGAIAETTLVPDAEIWPAPADLDDDQIIALAISGTGALIPLEEARIKPDEQVLILGATGPVGQIGLQVARILGAGRVVAAARSLDKLQALKAAGLADAIVQLGGESDEAALKAAAQGAGYDVILDIVYGRPAEAAMRASAPGARMMSIGVQAGMSVSLTLRDLVFRSHIGVGTGQRPTAERRAAYDRLLAMAKDHGLRAETVTFAFEDAAKAWAAKAGTPGGKIIIRM